jgi:hypothetical protein
VEEKGRGKSGRTTMSKRKFGVNWDKESLRTEALKWKTNANDFNKLCDCVLNEITTRVVPRGELAEITTTDENQASYP